MTDGLYLFLRNESNAAQTSPEFSGYYVTGISGNNPANATFFALNTNTSGDNRSNYTVKGTSDSSLINKATPIKVTYDGTTTEPNNIVKVEPQTELELFTATYETIDDTKLKFYADSTANKIYAIYDKAKDTAFDDNNDIAVEINLANVGTEAEQWTSIGLDNDTYTLGTTTINNGASKLKFYYNNDVEAGDSTAKLVDTVKLYEGVTNNAYLAFDFDLNVHLESVQVTFDEDGTEQDTAINANGGAVWSGSEGGATGIATISDKEITSITWTAAP